MNNPDNLSEEDLIEKATEQAAKMDLSIEAMKGEVKSSREEVFKKAEEDKEKVVVAEEKYKKGREENKKQREAEKLAIKKAEEERLTVYEERIESANTTNEIMILFRELKEEDRQISNKIESGKDDGMKDVEMLNLIGKLVATQKNDDKGWC